MSGESNTTRGTQATFTTVLGALATSGCLTFLPEAYVNFGVSASAVLIPAIAYWLVKVKFSIDESPALTAYKARLDKDLKHQKKLLCDKHLSAETKLAIQKKYDETALKRSSANQDFNSDTMSLVDPASVQ